MPRARAFVIPILAGSLAMACATKRISAPPHSGRALVALLPDADTGITGRAIVSNSAGSADLAGARASTLTITNSHPGAITMLSEADVKRLFGDALAALPPPPRHFTLYFRFQSDELTVESRALVPAILRSVKDRSDPEVAIIGHTDTMGAPPANIELGLKRAIMVRALLERAGLNPSTVEVTSHGEGNLLVRTSDETPEPRNRRVEISVR